MRDQKNRRSPAATAVDLALDRARQNWQPLVMAKTRTSYVCQNCGAITQRWQGKCESCGEWNTIIEEGAALGHRGGLGAARRGGPAVPARGSTGDTKPDARDRHRHRRARPGRRRRFRAGFGDPDRRRTGHRQVDAADPGLRRAGARRRARRLCLGRGIDWRRCGLRAARLGLSDAPVQLAAQTCRRHPRHPRIRRRAEIRRHRFHPDHVERCDRSRRPAPSARCAGPRRP